MTTTKQAEITAIKEKQAKEIESLNIKFDLKEKLFNLTGCEPSIISPENNPFAVFYPETKGEYLDILKGLQPTKQNFTVTFASSKEIKTFSPYSIHYGGKHSSPNYMEVSVRFKHSVCPIWVKMPKDVVNLKFSVSRFDGDHKGFGIYESLYTLSANEGRTTIQEYYGENKTMYAASKEEAKKLKLFIFSV